MKDFMSEEELRKLPIDELKAKTIELVKELSEEDAKKVLEEVRRLAQEEE